MARRATLQTIADAVGVSRSTVSNAYNRPDQLNPALRERILATARELGYPGPDPAARRLRTGQAGAVGLLFTEALSYAFTDPAAVAFLEGLAHRAGAAGTALLLVPSPPGADSSEAVRAAVVDTLCIYSMPDDHPSVAAALERRLPTVVVEEPLLREGVAFIGIDQRGGMRALGDHLVALGHRRVAVLCDRLAPDDYEGPVDDARLAAATFHVGRERLGGVRDALLAAGVAGGPVAVHECPQGLAPARAAARELLRLEPRPTAIAAITDVLALGALHAAADLGLRVPEDLSVSGFDDVPDAAFAAPPLTTVRQPLRGKGEAAAELLAELLEGAPPRTVELPVELVVRASTGPAPA
jgi:DNA-binding LacI/PurR family transcriptional regulator